MRIILLNLIKYFFRFFGIELSLYKNKTVDVSQKAGVDGRLFGSVTGQDILEKINNDEISINKSQISFKDGPIKSLGEHIIRISIHSEVTVELVVNVVSENQDENT